MSDLAQIARHVNAGGVKRLHALEKLLALAEATDDPGLCLRAALLLKESREPGLAHRILDNAISKWPENAHIANEKLQLERHYRQNRRADARYVDFVRSGIHANLAVRDAIAELVNASREARHLPPELVAAMMSATAACKSEVLKSAVEHVFRNFKPMAALFEQLTDTHFADPYEVHRKLELLLAERSPGCLLRIGDGEGAALLSAVHRSKLGASNLGHFLARWFGVWDEDVFSRVHGLANELQSRIVEADIVGVPPLGWIEKELRLRRTAVYLNCLEACRVSFSSRSPQSVVTDVSISMQMEQQGMISQLVRQAGSVSVISSRRDLAQQITDKLRVKVSAAWLIPPPASDPEVRKGELERGTHLQRFDEIRKSLRVTRPGELVLISAGFLGKLYGLDIKRLGGLALDIGFLGDLWVDFRSRPESAISRNNPLALK